MRYGDELQLFGVARPTEPPRNPGEFDMRDLSRAARYVARVRRAVSGKWQLLSRGGAIPMRAAQASRKWMQAALARGLEDSPDLHSLISGMVLGVRDDTPDEIEEQFQQTGTPHLFAVSGLNVAIVAHLLWIVGDHAADPEALGDRVDDPGALLLRGNHGPESIERARRAHGGGVSWAAIFVDRRVVARQHGRAAAAVVFAYDTNQLFSTGFQLSFAVIIAIVWAADP